VRKKLEEFTDVERAAIDARRGLAEASSRLALDVAIGGGALAIAVAAFSSVLVVRGVTRPLADLVGATGRLAAGNLEERVPVRARDEVGRLAEGFNAMAESIAAGRGEVEDRARTLQAVLDHVDEGIALLDPSGKVRLTNSRLTKVLQVADFELREAGGLLAWIRARATRPEQVESWQEQIAKNPSCLLFETVELGPPRSIVVRVYGGPVAAAPRKGAAADAARDAREVGARILVFRDATKEAEADRVKTEFISTVSHELRTPLTSVRGYVDLILGGDAGAVGEQQREFLGIVARNTERLSALINDLLDVEKLHAGKIALRREPVDLTAVLASVLDTFRVTAQQKDLALEAAIEPVPAIQGDADRLTQVFANLVSNAVKYTNEGRVLVRAFRLGEEVKVEVRDTGIGLTPEERGRIFEKFFRADNKYTRAVGGTGLGLAIVKAIVERHGARIEVASEPEKGSSFTVSFPAPAGARAGSGRAPALSEART
jgi:signal transduction histidine kinase